MTLFNKDKKFNALVGWIIALPVWLVAIIVWSIMVNTSDSSTVHLIGWLIFVALWILGIVWGIIIIIDWVNNVKDDDDQVSGILYLLGGIFLIIFWLGLIAFVLLLIVWIMWNNNKSFNK